MKVRLVGTVAAASLVVLMALGTGAAYAHGKGGHHSGPAPPSTGDPIPPPSTGPPPPPSTGGKSKKSGWGHHNGKTSQPASHKASVGKHKSNGSDWGKKSSRNENRSTSRNRNKQSHNANSGGRRSRNR
jgi:hypothetical protein